MHQPLSQIRISLSGSLGAAQIIFLAGIEATQNTVSSLFMIRSVEAYLDESADMMNLPLNQKLINYTLMYCATPQGACVTVAALLQYFLMAAFCWMLVEGIYLYLLVVNVYNIEQKMYAYHVASWGKFKAPFSFSVCSGTPNKPFFMLRPQVSPLLL